MRTYRDTYGYMGLRVSQIRDTMSIMKNEMVVGLYFGLHGQGLGKTRAPFSGTFSKHDRI